MGAPARVWCTSAETLAVLQESLTPYARADLESWLIADVSLGAWRGHQVATELCQQLGVSAPRRSWPALTGPRPSFADLIGHGIDVESRGDASALIALDAVEHIANRVRAPVRRTVIVVAPRTGLRWEPEDVLLVQLLATRLHAPANMVVAYPDPPSLDDDLLATVTAEWLTTPSPRAPLGGAPEAVTLIPGIVAPEMGRMLGVTATITNQAPIVALPSGFFLVAPEFRRLPPEVPRLHYDQLGAAAAGVHWLQAYAQYRGNNLFVDSTFLLSQSWERFAEGGGGIALRLLARAEECAPGPTAQAIAQCQAEGMRIAMGHFADAAVIHDPSPAVPRELRGFLALAKAYGLVMINQVEDAQPLLSEAEHILQDSADGREILYLVNIAALGALKQGEPKHALTLEDQIEVRAERLPRTDWRLRYVNLINIARLQRRLGDLEESRHAYTAAFATTLGSRSEGEALYTNLCCARLDAERGDYHTAWLSWLRAALHWAAATAPEALSRRVASAVTGGPLGSRLDLDERVCSALLAHLLSAARLAGLPSSERTSRYDEGRPPAFLRADAADAARLHRPDWAVGAPGWSLLAVAPAGASVSCARPSSRRLRAALVDILANLTDAPHLTDAEALVVDDRLGQEIAQTPHELLETALRLSIPNVWFIGASPLVLDSATVSRLQASLLITRGRAVDTIIRSQAGAVATFRRGRPERSLPDDIASAVDAQGSRRSVDDLSALLGRSRRDRDLLGELRVLEAEHVLYLTCSEETCAAAGISWPSKANSPVTSPL
jgi:hypothetical protein